jgi:antitoxin PrlF
MIASNLASKAETAIPRAARAALDLKEGDEIAYEITENRVILSKATPTPVGNSFLTFDEWLGEADRKAYACLQSYPRPR